MFGRIVSALSVCLFFVFASCGAPAPSGTVQDPAVVDVSKPTGIVLVQDAGLWTIDGDTAKWKAALTVGEVVYWGGQSRTALIEKTGDRDFVSVTRSDGTEGWIIKIQIAQAAKPGVVVADKSLFYSQPKNTNVTGKGLTKGSIVAVFNEGGADNFYKVSAYDTAGKAYLSDQYLRKEDVSVEEADVQSAILLSLGLAAKSEDQKKALLGSALRDYPGSLFAAQIQSVLTPTSGSSGSDPATDTIGSWFTIKADSIEVYTGFNQTGTDAGQLSSGTDVYAFAKTTASYDRNGQQDYWYHINKPVDGWVFGADVEARGN